MNPAVPNPSSLLADENRLNFLKSTGLMEAQGNAELDRISFLVAKILQVPVCLVSLVDSDCQIFPGAAGLPSPWSSARRTPLSHSFCKHVVVTKEPLIVVDARNDALVAENLAIRDLGVESYLGFPIVTLEGIVLGSFCVIDSLPRQWSEHEIGIIREFAAIVAHQVELKATGDRHASKLDVVIHDLKTPLSGVTMVAGLLQEQSHHLPGNFQPMMEALVNSGKQAMDLLDSLTKREEIEQRRCEKLSATMMGTLNALEPTALKKGISLQKVIPVDLPSVGVEPWMVERILENLVSNAIKFSPFSSQVSVVATAEDQWVKLEVIDQGPGFSEDDRLRLFQRYSRLSASPTDGETSTGLGLSIVKRLIDQFSGHISLRSVPGKGAEFEVLLPVAASDESLELVL